MSLTEEQRALMRLLLAGDTYEGVAEVLGTSPDEVRERAHTAAAALERDSSPDVPAAVVMEDRLRELDQGAPQAPAAPPRALSVLRPPLPWLAAAGALVVLVIVLALTVLGGGGDDADTPAPDREDAVAIRLAPIGDSKAQGIVTIIRLGDQPALDLDLRGLDPSGPDETYVLWFVGSGGRSLPVTFQAVGADGRISGRASIPSAASGLLPSFDSVELTLTSKRDAATAIGSGVESGTLPERVGTTILRGTLPG